MTTLLKISGLLFAFMVFLTITVNEQPIFFHIYKVISPATTYVQDSTERLFSKGLAKSQVFSKKLFDNSVPRMKDSVKSKLSAPSQKVNEPLERITPKDKAELDQLIKNH